MKSIYDVIKRPIVTEKSQLLAEDGNRFVFEVALKSTKPEIRHAVETIFGVNVTSVNTTIMQGKRKRFGRTLGKRSNWKKAYVALADGETIDFFGEEEEL